MSGPRIAAIQNITDQALIRRYAENQPQAVIRQAVVKLIDDEKFLIQRLTAEPSLSVRATIVETLQTNSLLHEVALTGYHQDVREKALQRMREIGRKSTADVVTAHQALRRRVRTLKAETASRTTVPRQH